MKLSISNIAWDKNEDLEVYKFLEKSQVKYIDIAPGRIFADPINAKTSEIKEFTSVLKDYDLKVAGMQALVFGRADLELFNSKSKRLEFLNYLKKIIDLGYSIGASAAVFGSPKNRIIGDMDKNEVVRISREFFTDISNHSKQAGITFCIEPNPTIYGGDYITKTQDAFELVRHINHDYFKVNLDLGTIIANDENLNMLDGNVDLIGHAHISEPFLKKINSKIHRDYILKLQKLNYNKFVAIEMAKNDEDSFDNIQSTIDLINKSIDNVG